MRFNGHTHSYFSNALTHVGKVRERNEDAFLDRPDLGLWAVADGMGGHYAGDYASARIVDALHDIDPPSDPSHFMEAVRRRLAEVDSELRNRAVAFGRGALIASTVVALLVFGRYFACVWAGDSRLYLLRDGMMRQLTHDHSRVEELIREGELDERDAATHPDANVLTRGIGAGSFELDTLQDRIYPGDIFLLCSDGLYKMMSAPEIERSLIGTSSAEAGNRLLEIALDRGAIDNVTIVLVNVDRN